MRLTPEKLLKQARERGIFVHRYKWSHINRRRITRRMCHDGLLTLVLETHEGFLYRATEKKK